LSSLTRNSDTDPFFRSIVSIYSEKVSGPAGDFFNRSIQEEYLYIQTFSVCVCTAAAGVVILSAAQNIIPSRGGKELCCKGGINAKKGSRLIFKIALGALYLLHFCSL